MTEEEILTMDPSVEMGNLVATEVMGWHKEENHWVTPEGFWIKAEGLDGWYPWRDIAAAWRVVEKLGECYGVTIRLDPPVGDVRKVLCGVCDLQDWFKVEAYGNSAPEAICKAALLVKHSRENMHTKQKG